MDTNGTIELLWNIVGVIAALSLSCIVAYAWGVGDGYKRGIETGKITMAKLMHDTLHGLKEVCDERKDTQTHHKRRYRRS